MKETGLAERVSVESRLTLAFVIAAIGLGLLTWATAPRRVAPARLQERGQPFFPEFVDPNAASSLEVVEFDSQAMRPRPFKLLNRDGRWTIPSHDNYPADAHDRLSLIAASIIALRKDDVASDDPADRERCGVIDPEDQAAPIAGGRGTRITMKGTNDKPLADIIIGKPVEDRPALRYVRLPDQKRIYIARVGRLDVSTHFEDWIERNLLQVQREDIDQIIVRNYSTDPRSGTVTLREMFVLRKQARDRWALDGLRSGESLDTYRMNLLVTKLTDLAIVDVRRKPPTVTAALTSTTGGRGFQRADVADLAGKGFYFGSDGQLLSNQGEVVVHTSSGVFYVLRFGAVAYEPHDARYLFISVAFDPNANAEPLSGREHQRLDVLRARFAPWYYLIANSDFDSIRVGRRDLLGHREVVKRE